jgi:hypothetical protein
MSIVLRILLVAFSIAFLTGVFYLVAQRRLQLKYSLLWMAVSILLILCALFPGLVAAIGHAMGFELASNFVLAVGLICLMGISLSLTVIVSWQSRDIHFLIQRVSLIEQKIEKEKTIDKRKSSTNEFKKKK